MTPAGGAAAPGRTPHRAHGGSSRAAAGATLFAHNGFSLGPGPHSPDSMTLPQDPRLTFDTFAVGSGNRMAAAAARRVAESPGSSVNPLFVHGASGVGKTHLLHATVGLARALRPDLVVVWENGESLADRISAAVAGGMVQAFRDVLLDAQLVVVDDVHHLAGKLRTQEELLAVWDELLAAGVQVVVAADAAPAELHGLDDRLRQRMANGLAVDLAPPEPEARLEIIRRGAADRGLDLATGVDAALAGLPVNGLHEGLDRIAEVQAARGAPVQPAEVPGLVAEAQQRRPNDEFHAWLSDIAVTVEQMVEEAPWRRRLAEAILRFEGEGIRTRRLETALDTDTAPDVDAVLDSFAADVGRLREMAGELVRLKPDAARDPMLTDPDRLDEVEALLKAAQSGAASAAEANAPPVDRWYYTNAEKVAWGWVGLEDRLLEELG